MADGAPGSNAASPLIIDPPLPHGATTEASSQASVAAPSRRPKVLIIGSGFGGSITALRLLQSKRFDVTLLERGHRYQPGDFPKIRLPDTVTSNPEWAYSGRIPDFTRLLWRVDRGLWDLRNLGGLQTLQAAGLGGGSLVYGGVHYRAPDVVFRSWPKHQCRVPNCSACSKHPVNSELLAPHYTTVERALGVSYPEDRYPKSVEFEDAAAKLGRRAEQVPLAIHFRGAPPAGKPPDSPLCTGCGQCVSGCSDGGKNTLDRTYLALAERCGLAVRTLCEVTSIEALPDGVADISQLTPRYRVHFRDHFLGAKAGHLDADYVFVCAGAVNSTELLRHSITSGRLKEVEGLSQVGKRFWANGDALGVAFDTERPWASASGPTITRSIGHVEPKAPSGVNANTSLSDVAALDNDPKPDWFLVQNGGFPPNLVPGLSLLTSPAFLAGNAYAPTVAATPRRQPQLWSWLSRAARLNPNPNLEGLVAALPADVQAFLPIKHTYPDLVRLFLGSQVETIRQGLPKGSWYSPLRWLRRALLRLYSSRSRFVDDVRQALSKQPGIGPVLDMPHSVALAAHATERFLLGPKPDDHTAVFLAMGVDSEWELTYSPLGRHRLFARALNPEQVNRLYRVEERLMRDLANAAKGQLRTNPGFSVGKRPITVHGQGGCTMGASPEHSVVDPTGEVWGHPGLFIADGSILPSSVGVNPSHTISALAELNAAHFIERTKHLPLEDEGRPPLAPVHEPDAPTPATSVRPRSVKLTSQLPNVALTSDVSGKPNVEYVPIATSPTSFVWRERFAGFLAPTSEVYGGYWASELHHEGQLDPDSYQNHYHRGVFAGHALELNLDAKVTDLDVFLAQPEPVARVSGKANLRVAEPEPHVRIYDVSGTLTLRFNVDSQPGKQGKSHAAPFLVTTTPTMHYDLSFTPSEQALASEKKRSVRPRRLLGTKLLVDDPGLDAWQDLTTLFTDIIDDEDNICLAGVIRVSLQDFINQQLPSFAVDPERSAGLSDTQRALALARFLKRFFGDVARLYDAGGLV